MAETKQPPTSNKPIDALTIAEIINLFLNKNIFSYDGAIKIKEDKIINCHINKRMTQQGQPFLDIELNSGQPNQFTTQIKFVSTLEIEVLPTLLKLLETMGLYAHRSIEHAVDITTKMRKEIEAHRNGEE